MIENVKADLERSFECLSHVFELGDQALVYKKSLRMYNSDLHRTALFQASLLVMATQPQGAVLIRHISLEVAVYNVEGRIPSQHPR